MNTRRISLLALVAFGLAGPWIGIYPTFLMKFWCFALFACAFNLLAGYGGLMSFGHAAFFGGGAYFAGYLMKALGLPNLLGIAAGGIFGALIGCAIGFLAVRRKGIYFSMVTLALAQMVYFLAVQLPATGGEDGLQGIPRGEILHVLNLADNTHLYYVVFAVFLAGFLLIMRIIDSPFGQALQSIRQNEPRAISLGYDVQKYKLAAFVISAALAGVAGATKGIVFQLASLTDVHWTMSGEIILMTLLGGIGTLYGPILGALLVVALENQLASTAGSWGQVILGIVFMLCVSGFRQGIVGTVAPLWRRVRARVRAKAIHDPTCFSASQTPK